MAPKTEKKRPEEDNIAQKYVKLKHEEQILLRPGMYIGPVDKDVSPYYLFDTEEKRIVLKDNVTFVPGLNNIVDEILVNTLDHAIRMQEVLDEAKAKNQDASHLHPVKTIKVNINKKTGEISVFNDGNGIPVVEHPEHQVFIPELIFGNLLTSTNYAEDKVRTIGGQNGIGAKACNIFSRYFSVETVDEERGLVYKQDFEKNMTVKGKPSIRKCSKKPYTRITFTPDYPRFNIMHATAEEDMLSDDIYQIFLKRCYDLCALTSADVTVWLNDEKLTYKTFERYVDLYLGDKSEHFRVVEKINDRWEIAATFTDKIGMEQVSFVNGVWTTKGGKHVDYISNMIAKDLAEMINKRRKNVDVKPNHVKNYLMVFVKCTIDNPSFDSQTKDTLTTPISKFGSKADISEKFIDKLYKSDIVDKILNLCDKSALAQNKKTDGKKQNKVRGLVKLDDANWAGTAKSKECTLILTEGDSAKTMALEGLAEVGRDKYGVFPLRGKLMNVKDVTDKKMVDNKEIQAIKKILGLESGKKYKSTDELRYGRIMLLVDADVDGSHIRGLIMNMFHTLWPTLIVQDDFITSMVTPIVKVSKGKTEHSFYNLTDYQNWFNETQAASGVKDWRIKYYKGLGTSNDEEAKSYFKDMHTVFYDFDSKENVDYVFDLAFNKKKTNERKAWIGNYDPQATIEMKKAEEHVRYSDFVNKELIHFSVYDVKRSIPSLVDGLKPSQRKVMHGAFKRNLVHEAKVSQFAGYVSEHSAYHHGEASLQATIVGMAQDYVGSNNMQLLMPNGMFGSRNMGGKDAAQARYIYTQIEPITFKTFMKEDAPLLTYLDDDGFSIEPEYYVPIVPMALINGATGIGTGYSTNIPCYNPQDIIALMKRCIRQKGELNDDALKDLVPWYRGFSGRITPLYSTKGIVTTDAESDRIIQATRSTADDDTSSVSSEISSASASTSAVNTTNAANAINEKPKRAKNTETLVDVSEKTNKVKGYATHGCFTKLSPSSVEITELPIGTWTEDYKEFLETYLTNNPKVLKDFESHSTKKVRFVLHFYPEELKKLLEPNPEKFETEFKLVSRNISLTNMHLFDEGGLIKKYGSVKDIVLSFYRIRHAYYVKRKAYNIQNLKDLIEKANAKATFIREVMEGVIPLMGKKREEVNARLIEREYPMMDGDHNYLLRMPIYTFTKEKYEELLKDVDNTKKQLNLYENKTVDELWSDELDALAEEYAAHYANYMQKQNGEGKSVTTTKKTGGRKKTTVEKN